MLHTHELLLCRAQIRSIRAFLPIKSLSIVHTLPRSTPEATSSRKSSPQMFFSPYITLCISQQLQSAWASATCEQESAPRVGSITFSFRTPLTLQEPSWHHSLLHPCPGVQCAFVLSFRLLRAGISTHYVFIHSAVHAQIPRSMINSSTHPSIHTSNLLCIRLSSIRSLIHPSRIHSSIHP